MGLLEKVWFVNKTVSLVTANPLLAVSFSAPILLVWYPEVAFWICVKSWAKYEVLTDPESKPAGSGWVGTQHFQL